MGPQEVAHLLRWRNGEEAGGGQTLGGLGEQGRALEVGRLRGWKAEEAGERVEGRLQRRPELELCGCRGDTQAGD